MKNKTVQSKPTYNRGILLLFQILWMQDTARVKIAEKSRQLGWTWVQACDDVLLASAESGKDVWYIGYNRDMALEYISYCAGWAKHLGAFAGEFDEIVYHDEGKDILAYRIKFASGKRVTALSSRPSNLRGKKGRVVIDEAAFHENLGELLKAAMAVLIWGGQVIVFSSHNGEANEFNDLVQDIRKKRKKYSLHRVTFMEAVKQGLCRRVFEVLGKKWSQNAQKKWVAEMYESYGDFAEEELDVTPSKSSGTYFNRALVESVMNTSLPVLHWKCDDSFVHRSEAFRQAEALDFCEREIKPILEKLNPAEKHFFGEDFARSRNLSVFAPLARRSNLARCVPFLVELENVPFDQQMQIAFYIISRLPRFSGGAFDARGNGQYLAEKAMQEYGENRIHQVMASDRFYLENFPPYKALMEDSALILPASADVLEDHRQVRLVKGIPKIPDSKTNKGKRGELRHGDSVIAIMLASYADREIDSGEIEYQSTGKRRTAYASAANF